MAPEVPRSYAEIGLGRVQGVVPADMKNGIKYSIFDREVLLKRSVEVLRECGKTTLISLGRPLESVKTQHRLLLPWLRTPEDDLMEPSNNSGPLTIGIGKCPSSMTQVWLIRHGESFANAGVPTKDFSAITLTSRGVEQAQHIADAITRPPTLIVYSAYVRAKQTAQPTIEQFPSVPVEEFPVHEFTYLSIPQDKSTTLDDRLPLARAYWDRCDPDYVDGIGAESYAGLIRRVQGVVQQLRRYDNGLIVIFSHGQFIKAMLWTLLLDVDSSPVESMRQFHKFKDAVCIPNGSIFIMLFGRPQGMWIHGLTLSHLPTDLR